VNELTPLALLLLAGAMTPGPNNLVVWREAGRGGLRAALPAIAGIVAGSLLLVLLAVAGVAVLLVGHPAWRLALSVGGALYLAWLGLALLRRAFGRTAAALDAPGAPAGFVGLTAFQFLNPKSWVLVLAATGSIPAGELLARLPWLLALFGVIPLGCLLLWAAFGAALAGMLSRPTPRRWADGVMALLILLCAIWLLPH
jgi:threonine/homoserine/homoserine lactone efflux protein